MPEWINYAAVAAGPDALVADYTPVTELVTSPAIPFLEPQTVMGNWRGVKRVGTLGAIRRAGQKRAQWKSSMLWVVQFNYLVATYEGDLCIRHTADGYNWNYFNAVLDCGDLGDYGDPVADTQYGNYIPDFIWYFTYLRTYTPSDL